MQVSVELAFDPASESRIRALQNELSKIYGGPRVTELGVRPHISLTSFPDALPSRLGSAVELIANRTKPFPLVLESIQCFLTAEGVVYLAPAQSPRLRACHHDLHDLIQGYPERRNPYYEPDAWIPHCSIATDVPASNRDAVVAAAEGAVGLEVSVQYIAVVAYRPARELLLLPLDSGGAAELELAPAGLRPQLKKSFGGAIAR